MARYRRTSSPPLAALAVSLLLLVFHCGAAARPLPPAPLVNHGASADNGLEGAADGLVLQKEGAAGNGDELPTSETVTEADEEATAPCGEEGNDDECMQRRLLRDAHLDYIYTQHKGKP